MKAVIFTEGGGKIGFGHIMRCASLCQAFEERDIAPCLIVNVRGSLKGPIEYRNVKFVDWINERRKFDLLLRNMEIVIIDSYLAGLRLYKEVSERARIAVYLDDNKRLDYPKGIVVNGNIYAAGLNYGNKKEVSYLLGTRYTPLRKEFWGILKKVVNKRVKNILVTLGGTDKSLLIDKIISHLKNLFDFEFCVTKPAMRLLGAEETSRLMMNADICITAGGQTAYELARIGTPAIGICIADNQSRNIAGLRETGFLEYAGRHDDADIFNKISKAIDRLLPYEERLRRHRIGAKCVDGDGARRIVGNVLDLN